ncbi:Inositol phosphoceramide mannosyltransferase 3 [Hypsizygus marmoreus]|uniref:Inositol phosphoceramide mannosyltransferase 3 n=1 Tax=Hypsizygus marmoreus TaxID=39966 RepID=A0A369JKP3_HYPMA|nr:Inositol phosphoceramide mannosyltransferase 3 [Hypsizygus marmoreus]
MNRRRIFYICLSILALFLVGTVVVLSSVTYYLAINPRAYLTELEVPVLGNTTRWNATEHGQVERVPRIIHQTWKTDILPTRWQPISQACRDMMPDYEYNLWTDASSREFIATNYPWFLETFDGYIYPIQRADAIRYFVLHFYGGVYIDLDIGCLRPMDPLLIYPVVLPKTIPVGVSNDLMFAEKGHPLLEQTIHNLVTFDHSWILNYPTVMFSTGPMFLSAQYGLYTSSHPTTSVDEVRILPKSMYGKNAKEGEAPHSFFSHFYGSSWHADDAAFIGFLGTWGKGLMWVGLAILILGIIRLPGNRQRRYGLRRIGGYEVLLPRLTQHSGRWHLHLGGWSGSSTQPPSPDGDGPSPVIDAEVPVLHLPFDVPPSPSLSETSTSADPYAGRTGSPIVEAFQRLRNRMVSMTGAREEAPRTPFRPRRQRPSRGILFFLPATFTQPQDLELATPIPTRIPPTNDISRASQLPPEKTLFHEDLESAGDRRDEHSRYPSDLASSSRSSEDSQLVNLNDAPPRRASSSSTSSRSRSSSRPLISWNS